MTTTRATHRDGNPARGRVLGAAHLKKGGLTSEKITLAITRHRVIILLMSYATETTREKYARYRALADARDHAIFEPEKFPKLTLAEEREFNLLAEEFKLSY